MTWSPNHRGGRMPRKWKKAGVPTRRQRTVSTMSLAGVALLLGVVRQVAPGIGGFLGMLPTMDPTRPNGLPIPFPTLFDGHRR